MNPAEGESKINGIVIAACSQRAKTDAFRFDPKIVVERVNIREHVAWCQKPGDEETQNMAEDYLRIGNSQGEEVESARSCVGGDFQEIDVVGGGITGITAALEAAAADYEVLLVEKEPQIGGFWPLIRKGSPQNLLTPSLSPTVLKPRSTRRCTTPRSRFHIGKNR